MTPAKPLEEVRRRLLEPITDEEWKRRGGGVVPEQLDDALRTAESDTAAFRAWFGQRPGSLGGLAYP